MANNKKAFSKSRIPSSSIKFTSKGTGISKKRRTGKNFKKTKKINLKRKLWVFARKITGREHTPT
jgi:hypothetical protein